MHAATIPPLYTYEANYKHRSDSSGAYTHRKERFTDREYNDCVGLMTGVNYGGNHTRIQVHTKKPHDLALAIRTFIPTPSMITEKDTKIVLDYDGKGRYDNARKAMDTITAMIEHGPITYYSPDNPLYAYTQDDYLVPGITKSIDFVNTSYGKDDPNPGSPGNKDGYGNADGSTDSGVKYNADYLNQLDAQSEAEKQAKKKKIIIISIIGVAIVGFIVLAILKKKGKI